MFTKIHLYASAVKFLKFLCRKQNQEWWMLIQAFPKMQVSWTNQVHLLEVLTLQSQETNSKEARFPWPPFPNKSYPLLSSNLEENQKGFALPDQRPETCGSRREREVRRSGVEIEEEQPCVLKRILGPNSRRKETLFGFTRSPFTHRSFPLLAKEWLHKSSPSGLLKS